MSRKTLLLVDDNKDNLRSMELCFARADYEVKTALGGAKALALLNEGDVDVVVTDLNMPDVDGLGVLKAALELNPAPKVLIITAYASVETAVEALKLGAMDYLQKPINVAELRAQVQKAMQVRELEAENVYLREQVSQRYGFDEIIGEHESMRRMFEKIRAVAGSRATVLIDGESGTGKELVARAIHQNSPRANKPFVAVHCAALSDTLLESELFGHEKGAFTGADARRAGRFERADGGSLFLDEVSEVPLSTQVALLRVLETREFERVGGSAPLKVDVRLIAATNRSLEERVRNGDFREDLFYRLNVVHLRIPSLRERVSDIPLLVSHFMKHFAEEHGKAAPQVAKPAMARLMAWGWPGNVRELRNLAENLVIFNDGSPVDENDLPFADPVGGGDQDSFEAPLGQSLEHVEREYIRRSLIQHNGNVTHTADALGIGRRTLQRKIKEWNLDNLLGS
ncbi:sigma-54-dependent Fis family transcriptional regulator [Candidatus Sumerlaeota bacterium]|nr:sigma-54-dependent Fis family transcriptional regulator [Candidatus Sumerlaeota bacterium]